MFNFKPEQNGEIFLPQIRYSSRVIVIVSFLSLFRYIIYHRYRDEVSHC